MPAQLQPSSTSRPDILTPVADGLLNGTKHSQANGSSSKTGQHRDDSQCSGALEANKQKRSSVPPSLDELLKPAIVVKPHPSGITVKPRMLHPVMLIPRDCLPLSALDLAHPNGDFPPSQFYESQIKILELESRLGSNIMLAHSETTRIVYAIERERNGLYTLCKLGGWVDLEQLSHVATAISIRRLKTARPTAAKPVTRGSDLPLTTPRMHIENKKRRLAIEELQSVAKRVRSQSVASMNTAETQIPTPGNTVTMKLAATSDEQTASGPKPHEPALEEQAVPQPEREFPQAVVSAPTSADDVFQNIRMQYFEALYHSQGSLAYFAKGTLSRARATFHLDCDSNLEMNDLLDFLRGLIMTTVVIDKKYRQTIPEMLSTIKTNFEEPDHDQTKPKKRKTKKMKLGKDGLYPGEPEHIKTWWKSRQPAPSENADTSMTTQERSYHVSCIRRRETLLQMILILEVLSLETLVDSSQSADSQLPGIEASLDTPLESASQPTTRKRRKHNFPLLLDVHVDRLCIWQSTNLDDVKALAESQLTSQPRTAQESATAGSDSLPDFCVNVIVPFFSARLPDLCDSINHKLGGPVKKALAKPKATKPTASGKPKPGSSAKRSLSSRKKGERSLESMLSEDRKKRSMSRGSTDAFALLKSASTTVIPGLKREASEPLLSLVPSRDNKLAGPRPGTTPSRTTSFSSTGDLKAKRKAQVNADLKDAISALRRPNRALVGKEIVEAAEKRLTGTPQLKKPKKGSRLSAAPWVQVKATPANNRFRDVLATESQGNQMRRSQAVAREEEYDCVPPSSAIVPSSTVARRTTNLFGVGSGGETRTPLDQVQSRLQMNEECVPTSSPIMARKAAPFNLLRQDGQGRSSDQAGPAPARLPTAPRLQIGEEECILNSSPIMARKTGPFNTMKQDGQGRSGGLGVVPVSPSPGLVRPLFATPPPPEPRSSIREESKSAQAMLPPAPKPKVVDIYKQLGWDGSDDLDELA